MKRGSLVKVNNKAVPTGKRGKLKVLIGDHLVGSTGIAMERMKNSGYIRVAMIYDGWLCDPCFPEANLDVIEEPIEL
jgi:hypothetical protein